MPPRQSALDKFLGELDSTWGGRVAAEPEDGMEDVYDVISSGSLTLDYALRKGGFRRGRIHELVGPPDSGKTTTMTSAMASAQRTDPGKLVGYVDIEGTFDDHWAVLNGLDLGRRKFTHLYSDDSEDASDQARKLVRSGLYSLVVVDSIGGMESRKALDKKAEDPLVGQNAQVITRMCKHLATLTRQTATTVILVNQLRAAVGKAMSGDVSAGPKPMQHATSTRVQMGSGGDEPLRLRMEEGMEPEIVARQFKARVTRSKSFPPGRIATFWINNRDTPEFGPAGLNRIDEYLTMGARCKAFQVDGSWYTIEGIEKRLNGKLAAGKALLAHPEALALVRERVLAAAAA